MLKFAAAAILPGAHLGGQIPPRTAHRAVFQYEPREGYLYVRSRAISSRCNENWDEFPASEIKEAYQTFLGKPVFVNHVNHNHLRARGVIIDAALHEDRAPDGSPDTWVELLQEIDAHRFPKLAKAILAGEVDRTSMGCDVAYSVCSACGNKATTPAEYCQHIPRAKGQHIYRHTASGKRVSELIRETCYGLSFFENSLLVEPPADPTAYFLGVDARGLGKQASKDERFAEVGLGQDDDGHYVKTHRARSDSYPTPEDIPQDEVERIAATGAQHEAAEAPELDEYGTPKPKRGQPYENPGDHPWYKRVPMSHHHIVDHWNQATDEERSSGARWYPDAHHVAKAIAKLHPAITDEAEAAHKGAGVLSAYSPRTNWPQNMFNAAHTFRTGQAVGADNKVPGSIAMGMHTRAAQRILDGEHHHSVLNGPKTQDFAHLIEHGGYEPEDDNDRATGTRRHSGRVVMDRHALSVAAGHRITNDENEAHGGFPGTGGKHARHYYEHAAGEYRKAAAAISENEGREVPPHEVQATTWLVRQRLNSAMDSETALGKGRQTSERNVKQRWKDLAGEHTPELDNSHTARQVTAYGETKAPADVDTLREENCPVCGDSDTYDGEQCRICGFISPPAQFRDPDLDAAKRMDLRKQVVDPSLIDDNGELTEVGDGQDMPQDGEQPDNLPGQEAEEEMDQDGQDPTNPMNPAEPGGFDPTMEILDPSMIGPDGQPIDAATPGVADRNGDGVIQPDEILPDGSLSDPTQGGHAGPRELPYKAREHNGDPFTPGPDAPDGPAEPEGPAEPGAEWATDNTHDMGDLGPGTPGDGQPDLFCPSCGFGADATPPSSQNMGDPNAGADGIVSGDVCPNCNSDQLLSPGELLGKDATPPPVMPHFRR